MYIKIGRINESVSLESNPMPARERGAYDVERENSYM